MDFMYVMMNGNEWENMVIFLKWEDAIQMSISCPNARIEIFEKKPDEPGYTPTYNYYKDGKLYK